MKWLKLGLLTLTLLVPSVTVAAPPEWCVRIIAYCDKDGVADQMGSGVLTEKGVLTNNHVVRDAWKYEILFPNWDVVPATVAKTDKTLDLALLVGDFGKRPTVKLAASCDLGSVVAIHGYGQGTYLTQPGVVVKFYEAKEIRIQGRDMKASVKGEFAEISPGKARPGDSGGPVVNAVTQELVALLFGSGPNDDKNEWGVPFKGYTMGTRIEKVREFLALPVPPKDDNPYFFEILEVELVR